MTYGLPGVMTHRAFILPSIIHSVHSKSLISPSSVPSTMTLTQTPSSIGISSTSLATSSRMSHFYDNMDPHPLSPFVIRSQVVHRDDIVAYAATCWIHSQLAPAPYLLALPMFLAFSTPNALLIWLGSLVNMRWLRWRNTSSLLVLSRSSRQLPAPIRRF
jgi:hypothetical protein